MVAEQRGEFGAATFLGFGAMIFSLACFVCGSASQIFLKRGSFFVIHAAVLLSLAAANALAQSVDPPGEALPEQKLKAPANQTDNQGANQPANQAANQAAKKPANQIVRRPVLKPANANQNPNIILRNAAMNQNPFGGLNLGEERMAQSMSPEKLAKVTPPPAVLNLLQDLDDPSFQVREAASQKLLDQTFSDESIWCVLDRFPLSEEAHSRLLTVALRRVSERPRGALGIRMGQPPEGQVGVVIQATLSDMPAEKFLKAGDIIEEIESVQVRTTEDLVDAIRTYPPGREIKIKLRRPEKDPQGRPLIGPDGKMIERPVDLVMPLGNANDLDKAEPGELRVAQNMQLRQRANEGKMILRRFAESTAPKNSDKPAEKP
jgi:hypothetical protein